MSLTHSLCFVIIALCIHYVSLKVTKPETDTAEEEQLIVPTNPGGLNEPAIFHWPQGIVPFYIVPDNYDNIIADRIRGAMRFIESVSCVVFKELPSKPPPISLGYTSLIFKNPDSVRECVHYTVLGDGGNAIMTVGYDCMRKRDIMHALLHVLGFMDEVTHPQRDTYIRILWPNIQPQYRYLFRIHTNEGPHKMMVEYDSMSVMHFHDRAYSVNGGATIVPLMPGLIIAPSDKLSQLDIMKLRLTFGHECNKRKVGNLFETCQQALNDKQSNEGEGTAEGNSGNDCASVTHNKNTSPEIVNNPEIDNKGIN